MKHGKLIKKMQKENLPNTSVYDIDWDMSIDDNGETSYDVKNMSVHPYMDYPKLYKRFNKLNKRLKENLSKKDYRLLVSMVEDLCNATAANSVMNTIANELYSVGDVNEPNESNESNTADSSTFSIPWSELPKDVVMSMRDKCCSGMQLIVDSVFGIETSQSYNDATAPILFENEPVNSIVRCFIYLALSEENDITSEEIFSAAKSIAITASKFHSSYQSAIELQNELKDECNQIHREGESGGSGKDIKALLDNTTQQLPLYAIKVLATFNSFGIKPNDPATQTRISNFFYNADDIIKFIDKMYYAMSDMFPVTASNEFRDDTSSTDVNSTSSKIDDSADSISNNIANQQ